MEIEKEKDVKWPKPLRMKGERKNHHLYYRFHKDNGHNTDDCSQLKDEIEFLIGKGKLARYTKEGNGGNSNCERQDRDDQDRRPQPRGPVVNMISGGTTTARMSKNSRKEYTREVLQVVGGPSKKAIIEAVISFDNNHLEEVKFPHDDPMVIMGYNDSQLIPLYMLGYGLNGAETNVEGIIQFPMTVGQEPCEVTQMLNFLVIKVVTSYNAILGRTRINVFQTVASTYHLKIKFPTKNGIGMEKGDQKLARSCYITSLRVDGIRGQVLPIEDMDVREDEERRGKPTEDLIPIHLDPEDPKKVTYIRASLQGPLKEI